MTSKREQRQTTKVSAEERHARRAFRNAMSSGLKRTYDRVSQKSVPDEFMNLLKAADQKSSA
ncbi:NepR family anti-sigma factor [Henriciella marina]|uniref:NepR family anti-sigma factor n=1 Tax=Henriciella marina TaxID=453851 RepID=UPI0012EABAC4|nr:NepR family anti-sigma factor [Henriciella marina]